LGTASSGRESKLRRGRAAARRGKGGEGLLRGQVTERKIGTKIPT